MEHGLVPDFLIRRGIRRLNLIRLREESKGNPVSQLKAKMEFIDILKNCPVAIETDAANRQHYEVPAEFFVKILGKHMKYSCCLWTASSSALTEAEEAALDLVVQRAQIEDGMEIMDLGCGWGSLSLRLCRLFSHSNILAVSNSSSQRTFIQERTEKEGICNLKVITANVDRLNPGRTFDRIVSIEMFEHMRNYQKLLHRVAAWLKPGGKLFVHIFTHKEYAYFFETEGEDNWMGRHFFTGGLMPSDDLLLYFHDDLFLENHWRLSGEHYQKTAESWLVNMDRARSDILPLFESIYGADQAKRWFQRWRIFFMACSELWGYRHGTEWFVSHYLFRKRDGR